MKARRAAENQDFVRRLLRERQPALAAVLAAAAAALPCGPGCRMTADQTREDQTADAVKS